MKDKSSVGEPGYVTRYIGANRGPDGWVCEALYVDKDGKTRKETIRKGDKLQTLNAVRVCMADLVLDRPWRKW